MSEVCLPPEVCGALSLAQRHIRTAGAVRYYYRHGDRKRRHLEKAQKLVARAARLLGPDRLTSLLSECMVAVPLTKGE